MPSIKAADALAPGSYPQMAPLIGCRTPDLVHSKTIISGIVKIKRLSTFSTIK